MIAKIILLARKGLDRDAYLKAIKAFDVTVESVSTFKQLEKKMLKAAYQGVVIDLKTKIKAIKKEKELAYHILEQFPVVQLRLDEQTQQINTLYYGRSRGDGTLEDFIENDCKSFDPRTLRAFPRARIHLNVRLSKTDRFSEKHTFKTVTVDISKGGCFLFTTEEFDLKQNVFLIFEDLSDRTPIPAEIRWAKSWGKTLQIPGIGVKFDDLPDRILAEICEKGRIRI